MKRATASVLTPSAFKRGMPTNDTDKISLAAKLLKDVIRDTH